jgi:hypothetical protein
MQFMVEKSIAAPPTAEILALVPAEQARGTEPVSRANSPLTRALPLDSAG